MIEHTICKKAPAEAPGRLDATTPTSGARDEQQFMRIDTHIYIHAYIYIYIYIYIERERER